MKDNLIDEERAKQEEAAQESLDQKLERLGKTCDINKWSEKVFKIMYDPSLAC